MIWNWHKIRNISQWNKSENPEINPCTYGQQIYNKESKTYNGEKTVFFNKWFWENQTATGKRIKLGNFLIQHKKINSKMN